LVRSAPRSFFPLFPFSPVKYPLFCLIPTHCSPLLHFLIPFFMSLRLFAYICDKIVSIFFPMRQRSPPLLAAFVLPPSKGVFTVNRARCDFPFPPPRQLRVLGLAFPTKVYPPVPSPPRWLKRFRTGLFSFMLGSRNRRAFSGELCRLPCIRLHSLRIGNWIVLPWLLFFVAPPRLVLDAGAASVVRSLCSPLSPTNSFSQNALLFPLVFLSACASTHDSSTLIPFVSSSSFLILAHSQGDFSQNFDVRRCCYAIP